MVYGRDRTLRFRPVRNRRKEIYREISEKFVPVTDLPPAISLGGLGREGLSGLAIFPKQIFLEFVQHGKTPQNRFIRIKAYKRA